MPTIKFWYAVNNHGSTRVFGIDCNSLDESNRPRVRSFVPDLERESPEGSVYDKEGECWRLGCPDRGWAMDYPFELEGYRTALKL